ILTIPDRLPSDKKSRVELIDRVSRQVIVGRSGDLTDGSSIRLEGVDQKSIERLFNNEEGSRRETIDKLTSTQNQEVVIFGRDGKSCIVFVTQSMKRNSTVKNTFDTLDDAAKRQLSKKRPGILCACFHGLDSNELQALAGAESNGNDGKTPSPLQLASTKFLNKKSRSHVVNISFL